MHSLCTCIALHLHIGSEMNIFVPRLAMQCRGKVGVSFIPSSVNETVTFCLVKS